MGNKLTEFLGGLVGRKGRDVKEKQSTEQRPTIVDQYRELTLLNLSSLEGSPLEAIEGTFETINRLDKQLNLKIEGFLRAFCPIAYEAIQKIRQELTANKERIDDFKRKMEGASNENIQKEYRTMIIEMEMIQDSLQRSGLKVAIKISSLFVVYDKIQSLQKQKNEKTTLARKNLEERRKLNEDKLKLLEAKSQAIKLAQLADVTIDLEIAKISPEILAMVSEITGHLIGALVETSDIFFKDEKLAETQTAEGLMAQINREIAETVQVHEIITKEIDQHRFKDIEVVLAREVDENDALLAISQAENMVAPFTQEFDLEQRKPILELIEGIEKDATIDWSRKLEEITSLTRTRKNLSSEEIEVIFEKYGNKRSIQCSLAKQRKSTPEILMKILQAAQGSEVTEACFSNPNANEEVLNLIADKGIFGFLIVNNKISSKAMEVVLNKKAPPDLVKRIMDAIFAMELHQSNKMYLKRSLELEYLKLTSRDGQIANTNILLEIVDRLHVDSLENWKNHYQEISYLVRHKQVTDEMVYKAMNIKTDYTLIKDWMECWLDEVVAAIENPREGNRLAEYFKKYKNKEICDAIAMKPDVPKKIKLEVLKHCSRKVKKILRESIL